MWYYVLEQIATLTVCMEKEEQAVPICNSLQNCKKLPQLLHGNNMGVAMGEERVLGTLENHRLNLASFRQGYCSRHLPVWCMVSGEPVPACAWGCLGALWLGMCGPESKLMSSIKDRLYWASLKLPSPVLHLFFSPLTETELNSSLSGFLPCTAHSTTGAPNQLCPAHFFPWFCAHSSDVSLMVLMQFVHADAYSGIT